MKRFRAELHGIVFDDPAELIEIAAILRREAGCYKPSLKDLLRDIAHAVESARITDAEKIGEALKRHDQEIE